MRTREIGRVWRQCSAAPANQRGFSTWLRTSCCSGGQGGLRKVVAKCHQLMGVNAIEAVGTSPRTKASWACSGTPKDRKSLSMVFFAEGAANERQQLDFCSGHRPSELDDQIAGVCLDRFGRKGQDAQARTVIRQLLLATNGSFYAYPRSAPTVAKPCQCCRSDGTLSSSLTRRTAVSMISSRRTCAARCRTPPL